MVNAVQPLSRAKLRCREISEADIEAIADLLTRGFPRRERTYWLNGLKRLAVREVPAGCPRFGYMMESEGAAVGVTLQLYHCVEVGNGTRALRCNLSSWYVEPSFRSYASLLISVSQKRKDVTYTNISAVPHTWPILETQGFKPYCDGQFFAFPALNRADPAVKIEEIAGRDVREHLLPAEYALLAKHAGLGCLSLVCHAPDGDFPFVFAAFKIRAGRVRLPCMRLIYCRDIADFPRFAGSLGRFLLKRGTISVLFDSNGSMPGLWGFRTKMHGRRYYRGPNPPRLGDLAFSELVLFGP